MIYSDQPKPEGVDSLEAISSYDNTLNNIQQAHDEITVQQKELEDRNKLTGERKTEIGFMANVWGYQEAKTIVKDITEGTQTSWWTTPLGSWNNKVDESLTMEDKISQIKTAGIDSTQWEELVSASNQQDLDKRISRNLEYTQAIKDFDNMPFSQQLGYSLLPSLLDPASWAVGFGLGKVFKTANMASKFSGMSQGVLKTMEGGALVGGAVGASEYLIQQENSAVYDERVKDAMLFGSALGMAIPLLPATFMGIGSATSQALNSRGVQNTLASTGVKDFVQKHLTLNPMDGVLTSKTATEEMKEFVRRSDTPLFVNRDSKGNAIPTGETAMGDRGALVDGNMNKIYEAQLEAAKRDGKSLTEIDRQHHEEFGLEVNKGRQAVGKDLATMTQVEREALFVKETGVNIPIDKKTGKSKLPDDFYSVIENAVLRDKLASGVLKVPPHLQYISDFFTTFAKEGTTHGVGGIAGKEGGLYLPRGMNRDYMLGLGQPQAIKQISEMLHADAFNKSLLASGEVTTKDLTKIAEGIYKKALDTDMRHRYLEEGVQKGTRSSRLRSLRMDTSLYPDMFNKSLQQSLYEYADNLGGKIAAKKHFGMTGGKSGNYKLELDSFKAKWAKEGASKKDIDNMEAIMETVLGTRKYQSDPNSLDNWAARMSKKSAGAMYNAGFSRYTLAEIGSVISKNGLINTINAFVPAHKQMIKVIRGMAKDDPILRLFVDIGLSGQHLKGVNYGRFEGMELSHNIGTGERVLDDLNHLGRKVSFFAQLQDTIDFIAGGAHLNELMTMAKDVKKMTPQQTSKFFRYGLTAKDIEAIGKENILFHTDGKTVKDYNIYNWTDKELAKKFHYSIQHAVKDTVVRTDGTRVHRFMSDNNSPLKQLLLQYTQFPAAAFERLLLNMDETSARTATGIITSTAIMYGMDSLADEALVRIGVKDKPMSVEDGIMKAILRTPFAGIVPSIYDGLAGSFGLVSSNGYQPKSGTLTAGAGISTVAREAKYIGLTLHDLFQGDYKKALEDASHGVPIMNAWTGVNVAYKSLTGQQMKERPVLGNPYTGLNDTKDEGLLRILNKGN